MLSTFHHDIQTARAAYAEFIEVGMRGGADAQTYRPEAFSAIPPPTGSAIELVSGQEPLEHFARRAVEGKTIGLVAMQTGTRNQKVVEARACLIIDAFRAGYSPTQLSGLLGLSPSTVARTIRQLCP